MDDDWRERKCSAVQQYQHMLDNSILTDCTFLVGSMEKRFECHKLVLARASSVFLAMLYGPMAESEDIHIDDIQPDTFQDLLGYMYCDTVGLQSCYQALGLCYAASKYMLNHLVERCVDFLCCHLDSTSVWRALELANMLEKTKLRNKCISVMQQFTSEVVTTPDFEDIELHFLETLLHEEQLNITSELVLIEAAVRWATKESERKNISIRDALGAEAISCLRFLSLTPAEVHKCTNLSYLLTDHERQSILSNLLPKPKTPLVAGLCSNKTIRWYKVQNSFKLTRANLNHRTTALSSNTSILRCSLTFYTNKHIWIQGFEFFTQERDATPPTMRRPTPPPGAPNTYKEELNASLLKITSDQQRTAEILAVTSFRAEVRFASTATVKFTSPVYLEFHDNVRYCIRLTLFKEGHYPVRDTWSMMDYGNVKFVFELCNYDTFTWGNGGILSSILFYADGIEAEPAQTEILYTPPAIEYLDSAGNPIPEIEFSEDDSDDPMYMVRCESDDDYD